MSAIVVGIAMVFGLVVEEKTESIDYSSIFLTANPDISRNHFLIVVLIWCCGSRHAL